MKRNLLLIALFLPVAFTAQCGNPSLNDIADRITANKCLSGNAVYEVMLPSAPDPVTYTVVLESFAAPKDTIAGCDYLIDWTLPRRKGVSKGFAAYFDGNHYRYRDTKLQEYHISDDATPFAGEKGVARAAQFAELLPAIMAENLRKMASDSAFSYKISQNNDKITVRGVQSIRGFDAMEFTYTFDSATGLPVMIDQLFNPASISEQTVTVNINWKEIPCADLSEAALTDRYPEVFDKYRVSNFKVNSLIGQRLPAFTAKTADGERYIFDREKSFKAPTLIVFLDPSVAGTDMVLKQIRNAKALSSVTFDVLFALPENDTKSAELLTSETPSDEKILLAARGLIRDCGVTAFPTMLFCAPDGIVREIELGANNNLSDIVIQKVTLCL